MCSLCAVELAVAGRVGAAFPGSGAQPVPAVLQPNVVRWREGCYRMPHARQFNGSDVATGHIL